MCRTTKRRADAGEKEFVRLSSAFLIELLHLNVKASTLQKTCCQ